jgi:nitrate reductase gamma subunit
MNAWPDGVATVLLLGAVAACVLGLAWRLALWLRTPARRRIALTPAPRTGPGVLCSLIGESVLFPTLWRANRWTWLFGWLFHLGLLLVLLQHLRYVTAGWWTWVGWLAAYGHLASAALLIGLAGLWARRVVVERIRWITRPADHAMLALIGAIALSGVAMKYALPVDVVAVKGFVRGALTLDPQPLPRHRVFALHLGLGAALIALFPFGKLVHGPGLWLNPTRAQPDDARERGARRGG